MSKNDFHLLPLDITGKISTEKMSLRKCLMETVDWESVRVPKRVPEAEIDLTLSTTDKNIKLHIVTNIKLKM